MAFANWKHQWRHSATFSVKSQLAAICKRELEENPFSGTLFVFRNKRGTALKLICHDGLGYWLITRRLSEGRIRWWPDTKDAVLHPIEAQQLSVLLYNGLPEQAKFAPAWRKLPLPHLQAASASASSGL
jgi:hypothetical protein